MSNHGKSFLERLGVHPDVRSFFQPCVSESKDEIFFSHGEHAGEHFHRVPVTEDTWTAGDISLAAQIIVTGSAMDAIAWLHFHHHYYPLKNLFFIATGAVPSKTQFENFIRT